MTYNAVNVSTDQAASVAVSLEKWTHDHELDMDPFFPDRVQSIPSIAGVKSNSWTMWLCNYKVLTADRGKTRIAKSS